MLEVLKKRGKKVNVVKPPSLKINLLFLWDAFLELTTERHELGPIPWTSINSFAERYQVQDFDWFVFHIRQLDNEFITIRQEEIDKKRKLDKMNRRGK